MPDNNPIPTEDEKTDSFLSRLSGVVLFLALAVSIVGSAAVVFPSTEPDTTSKVGSWLWGYAFGGWVVFLLIVYIFGQYKEVSAKWMKFFNLDWLLLWIFPPVISFLSLVVFSFLLKVPAKIIWVRSFLGS